MDEQQRLSVFEAQTKNVRALHKAWKHVNRQINNSMLQEDGIAVEINTKILAVIYCALAEAVFSKLIHTPHGLTLDEIEQIKRAAKATGVKFGWTKCAEIAIQRVDGVKHNHRPNVLQKLTAMIDEFIYDPSLIRNKLAHGQWCVALNSENTAVNLDLTSEIAGYSVLDFYRRRHSLEHLAAFAQAGMLVSDTSTEGRVYEMSSEHHVRYEMQLHNVSNWQIYALQTEEERGEGGFALPLEIDGSSNITVANFHAYRVISTFQPFPWAIKVSNSRNIRLRNIHCYSNSKVSFDDTIYDATHNASVRTREFASLTVSG